MTADKIPTLYIMAKDMCKDVEDGLTAQDSMLYYKAVSMLNVLGVSSSTTVLIEEIRQVMPDSVQIVYAYEKSGYVFSFIVGRDFDNESDFVIQQFATFKDTSDEIQYERIFEYRTPLDSLQ